MDIRPICLAILGLSLETGSAMAGQEICNAWINPALLDKDRIFYAENGQEFTREHICSNKEDSNNASVHGQYYATGGGGSQNSIHKEEICSDKVGQRTVERIFSSDKSEFSQNMLRAYETCVASFSSEDVAFNADRSVLVSDVVVQWNQPQNIPGDKADVRRHAHYYFELSFQWRPTDPTRKQAKVYYITSDPEQTVKCEGSWSKNSPEDNLIVRNDQGNTSRIKPDNWNTFSCMGIESVKNIAFSLVVEHSPPIQFVFPQKTS